LVVSALCLLFERVRPWRAGQKLLRRQFGQDPFWLFFNGHYLGMVLAHASAILLWWVASDTSADQVIIWENTEPPPEVRSRVTYHHFSANAGTGRYGFFPPAGNEFRVELTKAEVLRPFFGFSAAISVESITPCCVYDCKSFCSKALRRVPPRGVRGSADPSKIQGLDREALRKALRRIRATGPAAFTDAVARLRGERERGGGH
jgi:hypothetical protein